jgi:2-C-methyl-D-erythritol 4-phosphate cytidylyltransferase / 2-C-methyl-D-erythritol 2,4-cyclodiphosphate synthase
VRFAAILVDAGRSERFGQDKLWLPFDGAPLWSASYRALLAAPSIEAVGIVARADRAEEFRAHAPEAAFVVPGGETRQESVLAGLAAVPEVFDAVLVHDAARPWLTVGLVERVAAAVASVGAAFPALAVTDTVKQRDGDRFQTLERESLVSVQTPQGARRDWLERAHREATGPATDDAALIEALGLPIVAVEGDPMNRKVTNREDAAWLAGPSETRTGLGYDVHAFSTDPARTLWLGGVEFLGETALEGHSDADALLHAITDALLGAAGLGDIGVHFPNTDPQWAGAPSSVFLEHAARCVRDERWTIVGLDATVVAERPKIMPRRDEIVGRIAEILQVSPRRVCVKATTNEGLGSIGRGEGIAAFAVATLARPVQPGD